VGKDAWGGCDQVSEERVVAVRCARFGDGGGVEWAGGMVGGVVGMERWRSAGVRGAPRLAKGESAFNDRQKSVNPRRVHYT